jgi:hypothetical protein
VSWKSYSNKLCLIGIAAIFLNRTARAQQTQTDTLARILERLDALEKQNQELLIEVQGLREELKSRPETSVQQQNLEDRVDVAEQRIKEQAETKVESKQKFPLTLTGTLLFDAYLNSGPGAYEESNDYGTGSTLGGATLRQSILGLDFRGPRLPGDGQVHGFLSMDFYAQTTNADVFRIRRGTLSFDWKRRSITFGQDKSLIAPLEPNSFARVGIPPLSGAGNLWLWRPQIRYEERLPLTTKTQAAFQAGVLQTAETYSLPSAPANLPIQPSRPALQARFELRHQWSDQSRWTAGIGFDKSSTHVSGQSVNSHVVSADLLFKPFSMLELSGTIFQGENFSNIGGGPPGISVTNLGTVIPIRGTGGWIQVALPLTSRLTVDLYSGRLLNNSHDLNSVYDVTRTLTYAGNILYQISPNVVLGFEGSQERVGYLRVGPLIANRYDATVAYLF